MSSSSSRKIDPMVISAEENLLIDYQFLIHELMNQKNVSRAMLAERTGLSKARLSQLLSAEANPTVKTMARVIHALGEQATVGTKKPVDADIHTVSVGGVWGDMASNDNYFVMNVDPEFASLFEVAEAA